ncbi:MAG: hypothetical protein NXI28_13170 [bacterium]|nr:hypothetical protein [bacterium]
MMRTHMLAAISVTMLLAIGCKNKVPDSELPSIGELTRNFASVSDSDCDVQQIVDHALSRDCSVMFVHVDWAMTEIFHRQFAEFALEHHRLNPDSGLSFHFADCTSVSRDYAPLRAIPGWQKLIDEADIAMIHGYGEIAWIENGRVLHVQTICSFKTSAQLVEFTERLMPRCS